MKVSNGHSRLVMPLPVVDLTGFPSYLGSLDPEELSAITCSMYYECIPKGVELFRQGDRPAALYIVVSGSLKVTRSSGTGRSVITELLFPGDICGGMCAVQCSRLSIGAVALESTEIYVIPLDKFESLATQHPGLLLKALDCCRTKFREQRVMLVGIAVERVEQRAARALLMLADGSSPRLRVVLSRRDFSELIGTTLETAVRVLSSFRRQGLVLEQDGELVLLDVDGLRELAADA